MSPAAAEMNLPNRITSSDNSSKTPGTTTTAMQASMFIHLRVSGKQIHVHGARAVPKAHLPSTDCVRAANRAGSKDYPQMCSAPRLPLRVPCRLGGPARWVCDGINHAGRLLTCTVWPKHRPAANANQTYLELELQMPRQTDIESPFELVLL